MDSHAEPAMSPDDDDEVAVTQVIARLRRVDATPEESRSASRSSTDDELLDQFWRRRSGTGHC